MLKHGLIDSEEHWAEILGNLEHLDNLEGLSALVERSVAVKQRIVTEDPTEKGLRKALNLGHTAGHAFESLALERASSPLTSVTRLCRSLRSGRRALLVVREDRLPYRQDASNGTVYQRTLRQDDHQL